MKRSLALVLCLCLLVAGGALALPFADTSAPVSEDAGLLTELHPLPDGNAAWSENFSVSAAEMSYLYRFVYAQYASYLPYYGVDTSVPLQEQEYSEGVSWFDFFMDMAKRYAQETLAFCEAARAQGLSLDQETLDQIQSTLDNLDVYAVTAGYDDTALYIEASYGPGVTRQALEDYITKNALASLYLSSLESSFTYTQEDLTAAVEADPRAYEVVDCAYFTYSVDEEAGRTAEVCEEKMNALAAVTSLDEFNALVAEDIRAQATEEELETLDMDAELSALQYTGLGYSEGVEFLEQAFDGTLPEGSALAQPDTENGVYTVYFLIRAPYLDESRPRDVRHILLTAETAGSAEAAHNAAEDVLAEWQAGEATEESFAALANEKSEDPGSNTNGGLYTDVVTGQMVASFEDWLFDPARQPGDVGVVDSEHGSHVMYYVGEGDPAWMTTVESALRTADYNTAYAATVDAYPSELDESLIALIEE